MIILIDFENTHGSGFQGVEYLDEKDTLVVYYSDENSAVSRGLVTHWICTLPLRPGCSWTPGRRFALFPKTEGMPL